MGDSDTKFRPPGSLQDRRSRGPHIFVLNRMCEIPRGERPALKVLDVPVGPGMIALPLRAAGFDVIGCDLIPRYFEDTMESIRGLPMEQAYRVFRRGQLSEALRQRIGLEPNAAVPADVRCVAGDMEERLPFPDGSFDYLICMEGIEHVMDRHRVLAEFRRVLKRNGTLLISTPNLLSVRARLAYALAGQRTFKAHLDEYTGVWGRSQDGTRLYHGHAFLINYFQLRYSLHHTGFRIRKLLPSTWSPTSIALLPFFYPLVALFTWRVLRQGRKEFRERMAKGDIPPSCPPPYREIYRHVLSPRMLLTTVMILEAEAI
jgi:2-polyprenyl-3-methyl-5-hydroxy-6-metoxy-1,4-benzoquinol methylase